MAASSMTGDTADARPRSGWRLLAFAYFALFALIALSGIFVVLFGDPRAGEPVVRFTLKEAANPVAVAAVHLNGSETTVPPPDAKTG